MRLSMKILSAALLAAVADPNPKTLQWRVRHWCRQRITPLSEKADRSAAQESEKADKNVGYNNEKTDKCDVYDLEKTDKMC